MASGRTSGRKRVAAVTAVLLSLVVVAGCGNGEEPLIEVSKAGNHGFSGAYLAKPYVVPDIPLTDTAGKSVRLSADDQSLRLVFFGYTHCPDICQIVMSTMASAVARLDSAQRREVQGVFVTSDPARDTRGVIKTYLNRFDPNFVGLTGSLKDIVAVAKPLGVLIEKGAKLPSGGYEVGHSSVVIAVRRGHGELVWTEGTSPGQMSTDIKKLLKESS